ncbi:MAG: hypothetical protein N2C13_04680 [Chloroflexota bacterium]
MLDDFDIDSGEAPPPEESDNRTFLMVAGGLGVVAVISIICLAAIMLTRGSGEDVAVVATTDAINASNTEVAQAAQETATAEALIPTNTPTLEITITIEATATATSDVTLPAESPTGGPTVHPATATVQALLTQAAIAQTQAAQEILTVTPTATIVLPDTGFADDIGLLGMITLGSALILIIFFTRRLRSENA